MALPADRAPIIRRLKLEAALARCENDLYAAHRRIAELEQLLRKAAKRRKRRKTIAKSKATPTGRPRNCKV